MSTKELRYGRDKTIHRTGHLDVEVDSTGVVVAVWYRCLALPFIQHDVKANRTVEMERMYGDMYKKGAPTIEEIVIKQEDK